MLMAYVSKGEFVNEIHRWVCFMEWGGTFDQCKNISPRLINSK